VDYARLSAWLHRHDVRPRLTLEQSVESGSPKTVDAVTAHRQGLAAVRDLFKWMA
jgi:inosose dehydratase